MQTLYSCYAIQGASKIPSKTTNANTPTTTTNENKKKDLKKTAENTINMNRVWNTDKAIFKLYPLWLWLFVSERMDECVCVCLWLCRFFGAYFIEVYCLRVHASTEQVEQSPCKSNSFHAIYYEIVFLFAKCMCLRLCHMLRWCHEMLVLNYLFATSLHLKHSVISLGGLWFSFLLLLVSMVSAFSFWGGNLNFQAAYSEVGKPNAVIKQIKEIYRKKRRTK